MINTNKLLPRSSASTLNPNSISDIGVIRKTTKKIDDLLKERLILSKIRYGIERQQLERSLRRATETRLEDSDDDEKNYDISDDSNPRKPKPGLGGILGGLFKGIISSIGGVVFSVLPLLLRFSKLFRKISNPFTLITATVLGGIRSIIRLTDKEGQKLKKRDVDQVKGNNLSNVFGNFINALQDLAFGIIAGAVTNRVINKLRFRNMATREEIEVGMQRLALSQRYESGLKLGLKRGRLEGFADGRLEGYALGYQKGSDEMLNAVDEMVKGGRTQRTITKRLIKKEALVGDRLGVSSKDPEFFKRLKLDPSFGKRGADPKEILREQRLINERRLLNDIFKKDPATRVIDDFFDPDVEDIIKEADEFIGIDESGNLIKEKKVTPRRARRRKPSKSVEQIKAEIDARNPTYTGKSGGKLPLKRGMKAQKVTGKKGLAKFISALGGGQFLKPIRKFISEGIGKIPIIGDLIGLLLDVFIFGEPVGRALFMAAGGILGGFLGGLAGSIGGPPGTIIGGIIGSIGGDILGAALYDVLFRRGQGSNLGTRLPISTVKGATKGALYTGGEATFGKYLLGERGPEYVIDSNSYLALEKEAPGFLKALNDADAGEVSDVLRTYASYEGTAGRERLVPVPVPQKEDTGKQEIMIMESPSMIASSPFSQHYRRG